MRWLLRCCAITFLAALLTLPVAVSAEEAANYNKDAEYAEGTPPTIPHRYEDTSKGEYCLGCHSAGLKGAPICPHPVRLSCTGCHVQGEIKDVESVKKGKKKK